MLFFSFLLSFFSDQGAMERSHLGCGPYLVNHYSLPLLPSPSPFLPPPSLTDIDDPGTGESDKRARAYTTV